MSIFDDIKNGVKKVANAAKDGVNKVNNEVNGGINKLKNEAGGCVGWIKGEANTAVNTVKNTATGQVNWIKDEGGKAVRDVKGAANEIEKTFEKRIPELVTKELPKALSEVAKELAKEGVQKGLNAALDMIEMVEPDTFTMVLGFELAFVVQGEVTISIELPNPTSKLTEIRKWAKSPPKGRSKIIMCIKEFGPQTLAVEAKFSGNGGSASWSGESKYDRLDTFLAKHGVS